MSSLIIVVVYISAFAFNLFFPANREKVTFIDRAFNSFVDNVEAFLNLYIVKRIIFVLVIVLVAGFAALTFFHYGLFIIVEAVLIVLLGLAFLLIFYLGLYPAEVASKLASIFTKISTNKIVSGFWRLYDQNRRRREAVIFFLSFLIIFTVIAELFLFAYLQKNKLEQFSIAEIVYIILILLFSLLIVFVIDYLRSRREPLLCKHTRSTDAKRLLENLAITAGVRTIPLKIIKSNYPVCYSEYRHKAYRIYLSVGILNGLNDNELSAVLAHELAKINSGSIRDYSYVVVYLQFYKALLSGFFVLLLFVFFSWFFIFWLILLIIFSLEKYEKDLPYEVNPHSPLYLLSILLLPNFAFMNFVSCFVFYLMSYQEIFIADLQAVLLTRYPQGLHDALTKIKKIKTDGAYYGARLNVLYFTGEKIYLKIPLPQPSIEARLKLLEKMETNLKSLHVKKKQKNIKCLLCHHDMQTKKADSHYVKKNIEIDQCTNCLSTWFDSDELLYIADLRLLCDEERINKKKISYSGFESYLMCPRCGILLKRNLPVIIPKNIAIWHCPSCEGKFLFHDDIYRYGMHRLGKKIIE